MGVYILEGPGFCRVRVRNLTAFPRFVSLHGHLLSGLPADPRRWSCTPGTPSRRKISPLASHHRILPKLPAVSQASSSTPSRLIPGLFSYRQSHAHVADLSARAKTTHAMAAKDGERSASSATRFTATTPHASSKAGPSRFPPPPRAGGGPPRKPAAASARASTPNSETPEQRVARLRAAHERAKTAQVSRLDQLIAKSRPFFDSAHRITVISLVGLTGTHRTHYDLIFPLLRMSKC